MKLNKLSVLCALACAAVSGQTFAAISSAHQTVINDAQTRVIFISGASAVKDGFNSIISSMFSGTPIRMSNVVTSAEAAGDYLAVVGPLAQAAGGWSAGTNVTVIYRVKGGSVYGVNPVASPPATGSTIDSLDATVAACGNLPAPVNGVVGPAVGTAAAPYLCTLTSRIPDAGVSDVAPVLFQSPINTEGEAAAPSLTRAELDVLTSTPIYGIAFGIPVTKNVGLVNLSKATLAAIMAGNIGTWDQVDSSQTGDILICRRVPGSGSQAVNNLYFGNYPCDPTLATSNIPADRTSSEAWDDASHTYTVTPGTGAIVVVENASSGDVRSCLDKAVTGGTYTTSDRSGTAVTVNMGAGGHKAIGVLSMDSLKNSTVASNYQFRSLDGAGTITWDGVSGNAPVTTGTGKFPTRSNLLDGTWDMQGWVSFNLPSRTIGNKKAFLDAFVAKAKDPAVLANTTALKYVTGAIPGGDFTTGQVLRASYLNGNQCAPLNRNY